MIEIINRKKYFTIIVSLLTATLIINQMFIISPVFASEYSENIVPKLFVAFGALASLYPFAEYYVLIVLLAFIAVFFVVRYIFLYIKSRREDTILAFKIKLKKLLLNTVCILLGALLLFTLLYSASYSRLSFRGCNAITTKDYDEESLNRKAMELAEKLNGQKPALNADSAKNALNVMYCLKDKYPCLSNLHFKPKKGISNTFSPLTSEVIYDKNAPKAALPFIICSLYAKASGFPKETDRLIIAYEACSFSSDSTFNYSGALIALSLIIKEPSADKEKITASLNENVLADLQSADNLIQRNSDFVKFIVQT